jgi:DNA-binding transcriptional LysR family regulator
VTRLIQTLELSLDTKLLNRTTRKVTVTADGAAYYERAGRLLGEMEELESSMSRAKASPRGRLKVDIPSSLGMAVVIPPCRFLCALPRHPAGAGRERPAHRHPGRERGLRDPRRRDHRPVAGGAPHRRVLPDVLRLAGLPQTPWYVPQHPKELAHGHRLIRYLSPRDGKLYGVTLHKDGESVEVDGYHQLSVNDSNAGVAAALAGLGILQTVTFLVQHHISSGALEPLFNGWCSEAKPIHVVYPPNRHLSNKVRVFVDWIAELFAKHDLIQRKSTLAGTHHARPGVAEARPIKGSAAGRQRLPRSLLQPASSPAYIGRSARLKVGCLLDAAMSACMQPSFNALTCERP